MRKKLPYILLAAGFVLLTFALTMIFSLRGLWFSTSARVPDAIAGVSLAKVLTDDEALASISQLHGKEIALVNGAVASYGNGEVTLWVSVAKDEAEAQALTDLMVRKIAEGRSPFIDAGTQEMMGRTVYALSGLGQMHFYWQIDNLVIWIAAEEELSVQALSEAIKFYR